MSIIKESKSKAQEAIARACEAMDEYYNDLESDEDFGPVFSGSTFEDALYSVLTTLNNVIDEFDFAHRTDHFGLSLRNGGGEM